MNTKRILVVDDDAAFAESIAMRCRDLGFKVETATTPLNAIVHMALHTPDLLCLDVNLPTGNGLDLGECLVRDAEKPEIPVIVLTGRTDRETVFRSASLRMHYLRKSPDLWQRLRPLIQELLPPSAA